MRIVIVSDWFSEKMGYAENFLPKALAALGAEVHLITSNVQPYFNSEFYADVYEPFIGSGIVECGIKKINGFTLHRLPYSMVMGRLRISGLLKLISNLKPDVVQTFDTCNFTTLEVALAKPFLGYKLFLESHLHASVIAKRTSFLLNLRYKLKWLIYSMSVGKFISAMTEKNYPISKDAAKIVIKLFGYSEKKIQICSLGVDTDIFKASKGSNQDDQERVLLRKKLGFLDDDIVCVYTGRFTDDKGPIILADAVEYLSLKGHRVKGLFIGGGGSVIQDKIMQSSGCMVLPFLPVLELANYYRAADIGVWPKQESTSQLDAMACGIPIIVSDQVEVMERVTGNGLIYRECDSINLAENILKLTDKVLRSNLGFVGNNKIKEHFSWERIATSRLMDFKIAVEY